MDGCDSITRSSGGSTYKSFRRASPPQQDQILSFLHMFSPKSACVGGWRPLQRGLAPPQREILDPPLRSIDKSHGNASFIIIIVKLLQINCLLGFMSQYSFDNRLGFQLITNHDMQPSSDCSGLFGLDLCWFETCTSIKELLVFCLISLISCTVKGFQSGQTWPAILSQLHIYSSDVITFQ